MLQTQCQLLKRWIVLSTGLITIHFITKFFAVILIHRIVSYPMDSPIHGLSNQGQQIRRNVYYYSFKILCHFKKVKLLTMRLLKLLFVLLDVHNKMHLTCFIFFYLIKGKTFVTCLASKCGFIFWKLSAITTKHSVSFVTNHNVLAWK